MDPQRLDGLVRWYDTLTPESVARIGDHYAEDARFKDPFNDVRGLAAIEAIFARMFRQVDQPRFTVTGRFAGEGGAMLLWDFSFRSRNGGAPWLIRGASHLVFGPDGRVVAHRDYWDAAEELYEKLPVLGWVLRKVKARL